MVYVHYTIQKSVRFKNVMYPCASKAEFSASLIQSSYQRQMILQK